MNAQTKTTHTATYLYPGSFFPEDTSRAIEEPTLAAAIAAEPDEEGYFRKGGWYAVKVTTSTFKRFVADDGDEEWVRQRQPAKVLNVIVGERVHADDIPATDENRILIANIRCNSKSGYGVRTRAGNWQIADDYDRVLAPAEITPR